MGTPRRFRRALSSACSVAVLFGATRATTAQTDPATIIPVSQQRTTGVHLLVEQCGQEMADNDAAAGFGLFDSATAATVTCPNGTALGTATQQSQIGLNWITASGGSTTDVTAVAGGGVIIVFADSDFSVTFELPVAANFSLDGLIDANVSGAFTSGFSSAEVSLTRQGGSVILNWSVDADLNNLSPGPQVIAQKGLLDQGRYTLGAAAHIFLDDASASSFLGDANFDLLFAVQPLSPCADASRFLPLGDLPGGTVSSSASVISADGTTVLGQGTREDGGGNVVALEAFVWTEASGVVGLGVLPGVSVSSFGHAISTDGSAVVGESGPVQTDPPFGSEAFRWTQAGGMVGLGDLPGGIFDSDAVFVSADGSVVVGGGRNAQTAGTPGGAFEAFRWTQGTGMVGLGSLPGGYPPGTSTANAMSADGSVIVGRGRALSPDGTEVGAEAFRWTPAGGMVGLGDLPGGFFSSEATAVSADGTVVAGQSSSASSGGGVEVFRWTQATGMVGLGTIPGASGTGTANAMSADGSVIVGVGPSAFVDPQGDSFEAFRWTAATGMVGLGDFPGGGVRSTATAVSADGSIVIGIGCTEAFDNTCVTTVHFIWDAQNGMRTLTDFLTNDFGLDLTGWTNLVISDMTPDGRRLVGSGINPTGDVEAWMAVLGTQRNACCISPAPSQPGSIVATNRYLSFTAGLVGTTQAIRVTFAGLPPPFDTLNGMALWVGQPRDVSENGGAVDPLPGFPNFKAATLQCQPFFTDWSALGTVHVFHEDIVPGGLYDIQAIDLNCPIGIQAGFSSPLAITTARWGDVAGVFDPAAGAWTAPDGVVQIADVVAILDKFASKQGAPIKARADLEPALPDQTINITDVVFALSAFGGNPYPFPPGPPPCGP